MRTLLVITLFLLCLPAFSRPKRRTAMEAMGELVIGKLEEGAIAPPVDQEVCFSPENHCDVKFWKFLQGAQKSLDIAIYDLTHPKIVHEIIMASRRIPVRVVADRRQAKGEHSLLSLLIQAGVPVRFGAQRGIMHNKFTVLDGKWVETGSFNYTDNASDKNNENQIYLASPKVVVEYEKRFELLWKTGKPATAAITRGG